MELWKDIVFWFVMGIMVLLVLGCFALMINDLTKPRKKRKTLPPSFENDLRTTHYRKARKNHGCALCGKIIRKGEIYVSAHGAYLGAGMFIPQNKYHKRCFEAKFLRQDGKEKTTLDMLSDLGKKVIKP
jgi:hypothetical protein